MIRTLTAVLSPTPAQLVPTTDWSVASTMPCTSSRPDAKKARGAKAVETIGAVMHSDQNRLVAEIQTILYRHDPYGLAPLGLPSDEYEPEARRIVAMLRSIHCYRDLRLVVREVFRAMFGASARLSEPSLEAAASDLWAMHEAGAW